MMEPPVKTSSPAGSSFENLRRRVGLILAALVCGVLWFVPLPGLSAAAHHLLAILGGVVTLWVSEAIPLPVTALMGPALCVVSGIAPAKEVLRGFADPVIFLFLGSFLLAEAMLHHGLNRRIAFTLLGVPAFGKSPARVLLGFGLVTALTSMWVSNTATTAMMLPVGVSVLSEMARQASRQAGREIDFTSLRFGTGLMLMAAFASSIGGLATPVGTPPNLIGIGLIEKNIGVRISFFQWVAFGLPLALVLLAFLFIHLKRACPADAGLTTSGGWIEQEKAKLGPISRAEWNVIFAFGITVTLWLLPGVVAVVAGEKSDFAQLLNRHLPESIVAMIGGTLLFVLPVNWSRAEFTLSWREAERIDWGTILLFGGGLALGELMFSTGLATWVGEGLATMLNAKTSFGLVLLFTVIAVLVSETTSNAASATMVVPVAIAVAQAAGVDPLQPALAACLGASMGFMLPVSTPPNAIVYGSRCIPLSRMIANGAALDVAGVIAVVAVVEWIVPLVF